MSADRDDWQTGEVQAWALESHQVAEESAYCSADGKRLPKDNHPNLDAEYVDRNKPVLELQLKKGGIRLAKVLNDALTPSE